MRALACLPLLALTACGEIDQIAARDVLRDDGLSEVVTSEVGLFDRPCQWSEFYAVRYVATRDGRREQGVLCATSDHAQHAVLRKPFDVEAHWLRLRGSR